jgi:hypothetical protein
MRLPPAQPSEDSTRDLAQCQIVSFCGLRAKRDVSGERSPSFAGCDTWKKEFLFFASPKGAHEVRSPQCDSRSFAVGYPETRLLKDERAWLPTRVFENHGGHPITDSNGNRDLVAHAVGQLLHVRRQRRRGWHRANRLRASARDSEGQRTHCSNDTQCVQTAYLQLRPSSRARTAHENFCVRVTAGVARTILK